MVSGKLYTYPNNFRAYKALVAAQYSGAKVEVPKDFVFGETNKADAFLKKFPLGKVPAFEAADGACIAESNAIAWFVANEQLRGKTDAEKAQVVQWMAFADSELLPAVSGWTFPMQGIIAANKQTTERAKEELKRAMAALNAHLLPRTYLASERVTLADIACCCTLLSAFQLAMDPEFRKPYGNVVRWFNTIVNQPQVKAVLGEVRLCVKMAEPQPVQAGGDAKKDKKAKKDDKKSKKEEAPKEEKDAAEEVAAAEPKSKDPFAGLPKSSWDMEDFKRFYSNNDEDKSIPYFWEKFDKDNYSIWFGEYKYPEELGQIFMSSNLVGGMFQRLEKLRKNAFASVVVFGENKNSSISGIWVWRGHELAFPGIIAANKQTTERAKEELKRAMAALNAHLLPRTYLASERVTLADIACCCTLLSAFQLAMDPEFRKPYGNVVRWFNTIVNQPQVKAVLGEVRLCVKMAEPQPVQAGGDAMKDKKAKKDDKKSKKEAAPKEEKDAAEEVAAAEPKSKDPFAGLPKSSWDMEDFKRFYSNNDEDKSIPYFWEKFDKDNYSSWFGEYKYPEELGQIFMSSNLVGGMFQRLEKLRKNAFASVVVFGENKNSSISGIWVWRGHELAFPLSPDWTIDYESYDWKKLDSNSEETKKLVNSYFRWEGEDSKGRKANTGKIFK